MCVVPTPPFRFRSSPRRPQRALAGYRGRIDWSLAHLVNHAVATRDWLEDPVTLLAKLAVPAFAVVAVGLWLLARPYGPVLWKRASASALVAAAVAMLTNQVVSHAWERPRPYTTHLGAEHLLAPASTDPSFPSDHAAAAFAIAVAVLLVSRRVGVPLLAVAAFVAFSRVALGVHYPSDVLAGAAIGTLAAIVVGTAGAGWIDRLIGLVSRVTDPLLLRLRPTRLR